MTTLRTTSVPRPRWARRLAPLVLLLALAGAAAAQPYTIEQAGRAIGTFTIDLTRGDGGARSASHLTLTDLADLQDALATDGAGHATSYHLEGTARGAPITLDVAFAGGKAAITVVQGERTVPIDVDLPGPVFVVDNSMLDGWQLVLDHRDRGSDAPWTVDVLVPQAAQVGTLTLTPGPTETIEADGHTVGARRYDASLSVGAQTVGVQLWLDADGSIAAFAQPNAQLRYVRQSAAQAAAPAPGDAERQALEAHLAEQRACFEERAVSVRSTGETLAGTLTLPHADRPVPALLLLPGSGPIDRNGNEPPLITNAIYQQLAYALSCQGYAVLRVDKLGIGASSGDGNAVTLDTYARNTADWLALLRRTRGIDPRRVGLAGHSEGGLVALFAVATGVADPSMVLTLAAPGRPLDEVVLEQFAHQARLGGQTPDQVDALLAQARAAFDAIRASRGVRLALEGELADNPVAQAFAHAAGLLRSEMAEDPAALAARIRVPLVIVQGGKDVQVSVEDGAALHAAAPRAIYLLVPDLSHGLAAVAGSADDGALPGPGTRLSDTLVQALHTILAGTLRAAPGP